MWLFDKIKSWFLCRDIPKCPSKMPCEMIVDDEHILEIQSLTGNCVCPYGRRIKNFSSVTQIKRKILKGLPALDNKRRSMKHSGSLVPWPSTRRARLGPLSKSARQFINSCCVYSENSFILVKELYDEYVKWATSQNKPIAKPEGFTFALDKTRVNRYRARIDHLDIRIYEGITLRDDYGYRN